MMIRLLSIVFLYTFVAQPAFATFLPPDEINYDALRFYPEGSDMTKAEFDAIVEKITNIYDPIVTANGGRLVVRANWNDDELNASAMQFFGTWYVNMYGGLARFALMTNDAFAMVLCHELGHHLAGFSFHNRGGIFGGVWAANEGQSDYFASQVCARKVWADEVDTNATFRGNVDPVVAERCDAVWSTTEDQNLCYRIGAAGESLAASLDALRKSKDPNNKDPEPRFDTPDKNVVTETDNAHPQAQCRMDTYLAGALCTQTFDDNLIPGKNFRDQFGLEAEEEAAANSCTAFSNHDVAHRPNCWYFPRM